VERWLPELGGRRVLRSPEAELSDTVPAKRPITVEDVLSFRLGFGNVFTPEPPPIVQAAEGELKLRTVGPPWPPTPHNPDQWIAALGSLPLIDQPGERFRYNTGAMVAGVLIERVTGAPFAEVLSKRVFEPLGMTDTAFYVPAAKLGRFTTMYAPRVAAAAYGARGSAAEAISDEVNRGDLVLIDRPGGWYAAPPALPDGGSALVSTIDDLGAFAAMLAADGGGLLSEESVALMLRDRTTARDRALLASPEPPEVARDFWTSAYAALA
jgi:CubicO group peptidase (beta-lactamase class C family)